MTPLGRRALAVLCLCALALGAVVPASAIPGTAPDGCDINRYAVYATDEAPASVSDTPFAGYYENQSTDARAVFDRVRRDEGEFVTVDDSEWAAVWTLPNIVIVNETGTLYRTQRSSRQCGLVGRLTGDPGRFLPALTVGALVLVVALGRGPRRFGGR